MIHLSSNLARQLKPCLFIPLLVIILLFGSQVDAVPYDYNFTPQCLVRPHWPQYKGGIVVNPELQDGLKGWTSFGGAKIDQMQSADGNKFIVASKRSQTYDSFSQEFHLDKDKLYTFSAWLQVSEGNADIAAIFKTQAGYETAGWVVAQKGCWSMLKGGLVVKASGPAKFYFESNNTKVDIWADSISLQPFTQDEWKSHQDHIVEKFRKRKVKLQALDAQGRPIANASVSLVQKNSYYNLGCAINKNILQNRAYQSWFLSRFKFTTFENELKWYSNEVNKGHEDYSVSDALMQFTKSHGVTVRGHTVFWDNPKYQTSWVSGLSTNDLRVAANKRINSVTKRYAGQLIHWDVVNENLHYNFFGSKLGYNASSTFYTTSYLNDKKARPFLNEYNTIEESADVSSSPAKYLQKIAEMRQHGYKGPLGIGLQGHFKVPNLPYIRSSIDMMASYKLPIWITELDVTAGPNQATYLRQILRELHAHNSVSGIVIWSAWSSQGCDIMCLTDNNFKNLATGDVVDEFRSRLSEGAKGVTDSNGFFEASLYHGEYEARISHPDGVRSNLQKVYIKEGRDTRGALNFKVRV